MDDVRERIAEFVRESKTAADVGQEALDCLDRGEPEKAYALMGTVHELDRFRDGILGAFGDSGTTPSL